MIEYVENLLLPVDVIFYMKCYKKCILANYLHQFYMQTYGILRIIIKATILK